MKKVSTEIIFNPKNKNSRRRGMLKPIKDVSGNKEFLATLCLICCFIDGLGNGTKEEYLDNLKQYFPDLCKELGAIIFYEKYRNGIVHEFSPKKGFGIAENYEIRGKYIEEVEIKETKKKIKFLNIERFEKDFEKMLEGI